MIVSNHKLHNILDEYVSSIPVGHIFNSDDVITLAHEKDKACRPNRITVTKVIKGDCRIRVLPRPYASNRPRQYEKVSE